MSVSSSFSFSFSKNVPINLKEHDNEHPMYIHVLAGLYQEFENVHNITLHEKHEKRKQDEG